MKIIFMGTPVFALPSLKRLIECHEVLAVCTQPDRPSGRGHKPRPSPVKSLALEHDIPVLQPQTLRLADSKEIRAELKASGAALFVVAAYGLLLPKDILTMPPLGCVNVHASLLPKYRGASPIHAALLNGETKTGITIMQMDTGLDTGDIILQKTLRIARDERFTELHDRMAELGGDALIEALGKIQKGAAARTPQDDSGSSHAPRLTKADALINWAYPTEKIINMTRALDPWPGPQTVYNGLPMKIWRLETAAHYAGSTAIPGTILAQNPTHGLIFKTGDGAALVTELQAPGGKRMPAKDYLRGRENKLALQ